MFNQNIWNTQLHQNPQRSYDSWHLSYWSESWGRYLPNQSGPELLEPKRFRSLTLSKPNEFITLLASIVLGWVLDPYLAKSVRPKDVSSKMFQKRNPIKPIQAIGLLTSILLGWVPGQLFSKSARPKQFSIKTFQKPNPIKTYKCHRAPDIFLIWLGAEP